MTRKVNGSDHAGDKKLMRVLRNYKDVPEDCRNAVVALGNFDGVHRGHQSVLAMAREIARDLKVPLGVLVFEPHPRVFFQPETPAFRLTLLSEKARQLGNTGVDIVMAFEFDREMADTSAEDFVVQILGKNLGVRHVVRRTALEHGFDATFISPFLVDGEICSSSRVRACLREGQPAQAASLLGHWWTIEGEVLTGDQRGRLLGFPTANLSLQDYVEPKFGVYAVRVRIVDENGNVTETHDGVANIGRRPTFDKDDVTLEVHIFDFAKDIYGLKVSISLVEFLRPERKFDGLDSLKAQIAIDSDQARETLALEECASDRFFDGAII
jgi:riboflavin kinase/FMN adenylyltransferase